LQRYLFFDLLWKLWNKIPDKSPNLAIFVIDIRLRCDLLPDIRAQLIIWLRRDMHCNENEFLQEECAKSKLI